MGLFGCIRVPAGEHESDCGDYQTDHAEDDLSREERLLHAIMDPSQTPTSTVTVRRASSDRKTPPM